MPIPDDDVQFEAYLKRFRPLAAEPLQIERHGQIKRPSRALAAWTVAAAAVLVAALFLLHPRPGETPSSWPIETTMETEHLVNPHPLTIRDANALLATAPSFKAAVDGMAFQSKAISLPKDKRSALAVLSEEKNKL